MVGNLLLRGMLIGILAGLLSFGFLKIAGEPSLDRAISFEAASDQAKSHAATEQVAGGSHHGGAMPMDDEPELFSRGTQAGIGLFSGVMLYNVAFGGLFALVFALAYRRMGAFGPRTTAALLAAAGIVAVYVVPGLKYPANPPSVGDAATIGMRTGYYFAAVAISLAAMIAAGLLRLRLLPRLGGWNAVLVAAASYLIVVAAVAAVLPSVNEVPADFPADVLWHFRLASFGGQAIMWATIGLGFGALVEQGALRSIVGRPAAAG